MLKHSLPSIEKFAAYLDGNLSLSELHQFSQMAEHDDALQELLNASSIVDDTIAGFSDVDLQLPPEISDSSFEIPTIPEDGISQLVALTPESHDELIAVAVASADEDISQLTTSISDDNIGIPNSPDVSNNHISGGDGLDNGDGFTSPLPEDL